MKVRIVEGSPLVRKMYELVFSKREHRLTTAEDGRKGLAALDAERPPFELRAVVHSVLHEPRP